MIFVTVSYASITSSERRVGDSVSALVQLSHVYLASAIDVTHEILPIFLHGCEIKSGSGLWVYMDV